MKKLFFLLFTLVSALTFAQQQDYILGSGDTIEIRVLGEEDLSFQVKIGLEGTFQYPFLGKLNVNGRSLAQVRGLITTGLKGDYLDNPDVDVSIVEYRPFFILGEVKNPKEYAFKPGLTVRQAVAIAGGFSERANRSSIELKRAADNQVIAITETQMDEQVKPGDVITVSQSFF